MKKLLLLILGLASPAMAVGLPMGYVQISSGATQPGGFNTSTGTVATSLSLPYLAGTQCVQMSGGVVSGTGLPCALSGAGIGSTLAVFQDSTLISSPTAIVKFSGNDFLVGFQNGATAQVLLNPATTDFIHNQNSLQAGSTAYTDFLYVGTSSTISGPQDIYGNQTLQSGFTPFNIRELDWNASYTFFGSHNQTIAKIRDNNINVNGGSGAPYSDLTFSASGSQGPTVYDLLRLSASQSSAICPVTKTFPHNIYIGSGDNGAYTCAVPVALNFATSVGTPTITYDLTQLAISTGITAPTIKSISFNSTLTSSTVTGAEGLTSTYGLFAGSATVSNLASGRCVQTSVGGILTVAGSACNPGGVSTLAVTTGTTASFQSIASSPTAVINFESSQFKAILEGGATAYIALADAVALTSPTAHTLNVSSTTFIPGATFYANAPIIVSTFIAFTSGNGVLGTTTNDNACNGCVGEYKSSTTVTSSNCPVSNNFFDLGSVILTPGDWDINGMVGWTNNSATATSSTMGIGINAGNSGADIMPGDSRTDVFGPTATTNTGASVSGFRASLSATTTYYLKARCSYSVGTPQTNGSRISARRVR